MVAAVAAVLGLPHLFSLGMFMDGVYVALLAKNLYLGVSSFWAPQTIYYSQPAYWDNPPLSYGILALAYKIFGDHYFVERVYSFLCAIAQLFAIHFLWKQIFVNEAERKNFSWLACLLFLVSPLTGWCYSNNLMENLMTIFTTLAIAVSIRFVQIQKKLLLSTAAVALFILLAFITKGPVALFPLALPILFIGVNSKYDWRKGFLFSAAQTFFFLLFLGILFSFSAPKNFLVNYFNEQVKRAVTHDMPGEYKPYQIFIELLVVLSPFIIALVVCQIISRKKSFSKQLSMNLFLRFILLGLCGSLPIAISIKQRKFYLLPSLVPFVMALATYFQPVAESVINKIAEAVREKISSALKIFSVVVVLVCIVLSFTNSGKIIRDNDLLNDLKTANQFLKEEKVIRADWHLYDAWAMRGYLLRLYNQKLCMPDEIAETKFYMTKPNEWGDKLPPNSEKIFSGKTFDLYLLPQ